MTTIPFATETFVTVTPDIRGWAVSVDMPDQLDSAVVFCSPREDEAMAVAEFLDGDGARLAFYVYDNAGGGACWENASEGPVPQCGFGTDDAPDVELVETGCDEYPFAIKVGGYCAVDFDTGDDRTEPEAVLAGLNRFPALRRYVLFAAQAAGHLDEEGTI